MTALLHAQTTAAEPSAQRFLPASFSDQSVLLWMDDDSCLLIYDYDNGGGPEA